MKTHKPILLFIFAASLLSTGCSSFNGALNPFAQREEVHEIITEVHDPVTGGVLLSTNYTTNLVTVVKPGWGKAIDGAKAANSSLNPTPTAPFINIGLGVLSAGLALFARFKTKRAARDAGLVSTLITGVELAGDKKTKESIKAIAESFKQARELHERVKSQTNADV